MTQQEVQRYHVLRLVLAHQVSLRDAVVTLGLSYRQANRLKARVAHSGAAGLVHQNRGHPPANRWSPEWQLRLRELCLEKYHMCNDTHCAEMLASREGIRVSRETIRRLRRAAGVAPKRKRRTPQKHHKRRERQPAAGMMVLWDGSPHRWFGADRPPCCLMAGIDDATSAVVALRFARSETSAAYLGLLRQIVEQHGIPGSIYQDRHGVLKRNDTRWSLQEQFDGVQEPTQVGHAQAELGITPICALSPQAKGRVERLFGVLQDRLVAELSLAGITDLEAANAFLPAFMRAFNSRFAVAPREETSAWRTLPRGMDIARHTVFRYQATVGNDNTVRLGGHVIDIPPGPRGVGYAKQPVEVRQLLDGRWRVDQGDVLLAEGAATPVVEPLRRLPPRVWRSGILYATRTYDTQTG